MITVDLPTAALALLLVVTAVAVAAVHGYLFAFARLRVAARRRKDYDRGFHDALKAQVQVKFVSAKDLFRRMGVDEDGEG